MLKADPYFANEYFAAALEEAELPGGQNALLAALRHIAEAQGMTAVAARAGNQWLPKYVGAQGAAMEFFESLPFKTLNAIGVVIVEGDHPGSTYYAAELSTSIEEANVSVAELELPFRFRQEGSDAKDLEKSRI